jgi:hypothetical protein
MTVPFSGGCICGTARYVCSHAPLAMLNCHCLDCQRPSGAPFASGCIVRVSDISITGALKTYSVRAGSGKLVTRGEAAPGVRSIRFPTLDNPSEFHPLVDIWTSSAQPWVCLNQEIRHYPRSL